MSSGTKRLAESSHQPSSSKRPTYKSLWTYLTKELVERYSRPPLPDDYESASRNIVFQQLEIDYVNQERDCEVMIRIFGVTMEGHSVCCRVHGFEPYFYVRCPPGMHPDDIPQFRQTLEVIILKKDVKNRIIRITTIRKKSMMHYQRDDSLFLKIVVSSPNPSDIADIIKCIDELFLAKNWTSCQTYEADIPFIVRFMVDCNIVGGNWIEIPANHYKTSKNLFCQLEVNCRYCHLISHAPEGEFSKMAPLRILSFNMLSSVIESEDSVISIANILTLLGDDKPLIQNVMTLESCAKICNADVLFFDTEEQVLTAWRDFFLLVDPDVIIGYEVCDKQLPFLISRCSGDLERSLGLISKSSQKQDGRQWDAEKISISKIKNKLLIDVAKEKELHSASLNSVSSKFLSRQVEYLNAETITALQMGDAISRKRLAEYCLQGAFLPQKLLDKLMLIYNYVEMARVTGVPISFLLDRGQCIKVLSQVLRKANKRDFILPTGPEQIETKQIKKMDYKLPKVLDAVAGLYKTPIAVFEFASFGPSTTIAYNLCYSTLVGDNYDSETVNECQSGSKFVTSSVQKGILPEILEDLMVLRRKAKADMEKADDSLKKVLNGRQLALKLCANSIIGCAGATTEHHRMLYCQALATSIEIYGRKIFNGTKNLVENSIHLPNAKVIYGAVDSYTVQFKAVDVGDAIAKGKKAADDISKTFLTPIKLEFENIYYPYLLMGTMQYAGFSWTKPDSSNIMDAKGIRTFGNCLLVENLVNECLQKILGNDTEGAVRHVRDTIAKLHNNCIDFSLLVITKKDKPPYVVVHGIQNKEMEVSPVVAFDNDIAIATDYYIGELKKPLSKIFLPILGNTETRRLFTYCAPANSSENNILRYFMKNQNDSTRTCLCCTSTTVSDSESMWCSKLSEGTTAKTYCETINKVGELETKFNKLQMQCRLCQSSLLEDVLCQCLHCPIFYRKRQAERNGRIARDKLNLLDLDKYAW